VRFRFGSGDVHSPATDFSGVQYRALAIVKLLVRPTYITVRLYRRPVSPVCSSDSQLGPPTIARDTVLSDWGFRLGSQFLVRNQLKLFFGA